MADTFTKLFSGIIASTVWQEPDSTRLTWITMLAMADKDGMVAASVPGLAHMARVTLPQCEAALATFLAPDPYSRTPDHDGRRIEPCDGGWVLLNHWLYRGKRDDEDRRARQREWDRRNRPSGHQRAKAAESDEKSDQSDAKSDESDEIRQGPTQADTDADTDAEESKAKATVHSAAPTAPMDGLGIEGEGPKPEAPEPVADAEAPLPKRITGAKKKATALRFPEWYAAYPVKKGRALAEKAWKKAGGDDMADQLIAHVRRMEREDDTWLRGFIPHPATYLNGERWTDEPMKDKPQGASTAAAPAPETFGAKAALVQSETKLERELGYIRQQYNVGAYGEGAEAKKKAGELMAEAQRKYGGGNGNAG